MKKTFLLFTFLTTFLTSAQDNGENDFGSWHMYFGTNKISEKLSIHTEAQVRYYENGKNFNQLLLRTGLNFNINPDAIATAGYAYISSDPTFEGNENQVNNISEHRIFEQFILRNKVSCFLFEHRYRLEQRFIEVENPDSPFYEKSTQHRARYRLQVTLPLSDIFFLNFYDEIFLNLQDTIFGQNRLYGAIGANVFKNTSVQVGYLKNHFATANFDRLQIGVFFNPDLRKKQGE
jgi:hypothetical protein